MSSVDALCDFFGVSRNDIMEAYVPKPIGHLSPFELNIVLAYRAASQERKDSVKLLLGLKE